MKNFILNVSTNSTKKNNVDTNGNIILAQIKSPVIEDHYSETIVYVNDNDFVVECKQGLESEYNNQHYDEHTRFTFNSNGINIYDINKGYHGFYKFDEEGFLHDAGVNWKGEKANV